MEGLYYLSSKNKGGDRLSGYCTADLCHIKSMFSHDVAHF